ncbi:MAG TPA: ATP-binding protein [Myxococcaceae bacterium]|nr:ATP-binding protein [Myxococcaceae bacterium]
MSPPLLRRLVVRIYLVCLAQLLVVMVGVAVLLQQSRIPESWLRGQGQYVVEQILPVLQDRVGLARALAQLRDTAGARLTLYGPDRSVVASNVDPVLPLPPGPASTTVLARPPLLVLPLVRPPPGPPGPPPRRGGGPGPLDVPMRPPDSGDLGPPPRPFGGTMGPLPPPPPLQGWAVIDFRPPMPPPGQLAAVAGLVLATLGLSSALLARSISRPLGTLSTAATRLGAGDLEARAALARSDELGELGRAFDGMADRVVALLRSEKSLLAGVSHELRTPLARIRVALELAEEGDVATARASLADITDDLGELERLVDELLTAARLELGQSVPGAPALRPAWIQASALVATAAERFLSIHPEHRLDAAASDSAGRLRADPGLIGRVLNNLLDNAAKYSAPAAGWVRLAVDGTADEVTFTVEDHGAGITPEDLPHVFTPFFRADPSRSRSTGGFGLGLSLARSIAEAHGGRLDLTSEPGAGTRAALVLPRSGPLHGTTRGANGGNALAA